MSSGPRPRTLSSRSAILSALLGFHPAQAPVSAILSIATELGLQQSAVRVALTRMVAHGDLEREGGVYRLSPRLIDRQRRQDVALAPDLGDWSGCWCMAVVTAGAEDSTDRAAMREALRHARFGELREGVWLRPDNISIDLPKDKRERITLFRSVPQESSLELATTVFDPDDWAVRARSLVASYAAAVTLADRFAAAAAMVRHLLDDPVLPEELLPTPWPGRDLRETYGEFQTEFIAFARRLAFV